MKILIFGVSNVGKTTAGKLLAERLGFSFYDLDEEVKCRLHTTLEAFVNSGNLKWRDQKRGEIIKEILLLKEDAVLVISPISYPDSFKDEIISDDILLIELYDTPKNIFSRLVFSDENDVIYTDDAYKNEHKEFYMNDIQEDLEWYGKVYRSIGVKNRVFVSNQSPEKVVERIITRFHLNKIN